MKRFSVIFLKCLQKYITKIVNSVPKLFSTTSHSKKSVRFIPPAVFNELFSYKSMPNYLI